LFRHIRRLGRAHVEVPWEFDTDCILFSERLLQSRLSPCTNWQLTFPDVFFLHAGGKWPEVFVYTRPLGWSYLSKALTPWFQASSTRNFTDHCSLEWLL